MLFTTRSGNFVVERARLGSVLLIWLGMCVCVLGFSLATWLSTSSHHQNHFDVLHYYLYRYRSAVRWERIVYFYRNSEDSSYCKSYVAYKSSSLRRPNVSYRTFPTVSTCTRSHVSDGMVVWTPRVYSAFRYRYLLYRKLR